MCPNAEAVPKYLSQTNLFIQEGQATIKMEDGSVFKLSQNETALLPTGER